MMRVIIAAIAVAGAVGAIAVAAPPPVASGAALFGEKCAMCHRGRGMGSVLLSRRIDPAVADLEKRRDLERAVIVASVRAGIGNMPRIGRGEVSDTQLAAIAAYLEKGPAK